VRILVNRRPIDGPWGGGNLFVRAFCDRATVRGHVIQHHLRTLPDAIVMVDPRYDELGISINEISALKRSHPHVRVLHRVNECDARKGTSGMDALLRASSQFTDVTVFVSYWVRRYHLDRGWMGKRLEVVYNGVDLTHFRNALPEEKLSNGISVVTHHWSNNEMKGFDFYEVIDKFAAETEGVMFTYVGRHRNTFGPHTRIVPPLFGSSLGDELRRHHVYISGSWYDPGPNHVIEAIMSGLPTWVRLEGGGAVEFAGRTHTVSSVEDLLNVLSDRKRLLTPNGDARSFYPWEDCADTYIELLEDR